MAGAGGRQWATARVPARTGGSVAALCWRDWLTGLTGRGALVSRRSGGTLLIGINRLDTPDRFSTAWDGFNCRLGIRARSRAGRAAKPGRAPWGELAYRFGRLRVPVWVVFVWFGGFCQRAFSLPVRAGFAGPAMAAGGRPEATPVTPRCTTTFQLEQSTALSIMAPLRGWAGRTHLTALPSSRGPGHSPLKAVTPVRIRLGAPFLSETYALRFFLVRNLYENLRPNFSYSGTSVRVGFESAVRSRPPCRRVIESARWRDCGTLCEGPHSRDGVAMKESDLMATPLLLVGVGPE